MGLTEKHLTEGEEIVMVLRTHIKAVFGALALAVLLAAAVIIAMIVFADQQWIAWVVLAVCLVVGARWSLLPLLKWFTTDYTVTTKRVAERSGVITRVGRDIPLYRINDVTSNKGFLDRIFGCGTLTISDASDGPGMMLRDVPKVDGVQVKLHGLLFAHDDGSDDGEWPPTEPPRKGTGQ